MTGRNPQKITRAVTFGASGIGARRRRIRLAFRLAWSAAERIFDANLSASRSTCSDEYLVSITSTPPGPTPTWSISIGYEYGASPIVNSTLWANRQSGSSRSNRSPVHRSASPPTSEDTPPENTTARPTSTQTDRVPTTAMITAERASSECDPRARVSAAAPTITPIWRTRTKPMMPQSCGIRRATLALSMPLRVGPAPARPCLTLQLSAREETGMNGHENLQLTAEGGFPDLVVRSPAFLEATGWNHEEESGR